MEELEHHLWSELHDLFDTDDGDLPDIDVEDLSRDEVKSIYALGHPR